MMISVRMMVRSRAPIRYITQFGGFGNSTIVGAGGVVWVGVVWVGVI